MGLGKDIGPGKLGSRCSRICCFRVTSNAPGNRQSDTGDSKLGWFFFDSLSEITTGRRIVCRFVGRKFHVLLLLRRSPFYKRLASKTT